MFAKCYVSWYRWLDYSKWFLTYTFSQPIISATITYTSVNGPNGTGTDIGQISINGGGNLTLSNPCGLNVNGNILTCNLPGTTNNPYGDVSITVSSTCPFTTITLDNIGGQSGWVQGDACNFLWTPACAVNPPNLTTTSLSNSCPSNTVDLSSISATNQSSCYSLTWHTGTPATNTNVFTSLNNIGAGTYYASFFNQAANCYSSTSPLVVTINPCGPIFDPISPLCLNSNPSMLPTTSNNGMAGTWSPSVINTSVPGVFTYVFTAINGQTASLNVTILSAGDTSCCQNYLTTGNSVGTPISVERHNWIKATNIFTTGSGVGASIYHAGNFVELNPGFQTQSSSKFVAYIQDCSGSYVYKNSNSNTTSNSIDSIRDVKEALTINPNPSNSSIEILLNNNSFDKIEIVSIDGKKVYESAIESSNKLQVDVSNYANGLYIVTVTASDGQQFSKKLIKN